jgi:ferredoxin
MMPVPFPNPIGSPADNKKLDEARREITALRDAAADLQRRVEKQALLLRAFFALLGERHGLTEEELLDRFRQAETEQANAPVKLCAHCGRPVNQRHHRCLYCGEACPVQSAFELL